MSGYRNKPRRDFTIIRNTALRDTDLSLKAKGLLALMLSFPDDWTYYMDGLRELSRDGREGHQSAMKELVKAGYVIRKAIQGDGGRMAGWSHQVADERETRQSENTTVGKPATTKTDLTKTDLDKDKNKNPFVVSPESGEADEGKSSLSIPGKNGKSKPGSGARHSTAQREGFYEVCRGQWNEQARLRPNWVEHRKLSKRMKGQLRELYEHYDGDGLEAYEALTRALQQATKESWTQERERVTLDNVGSNSKLISYSDAYAASEVSTSKLGFKPGDRVIYRSPWRNSQTDENDVEVPAEIIMVEERFITAQTFHVDGVNASGELVVSDNPRKFRRESN